GSSSVLDYGRKFKALCDQLAEIGHPVYQKYKTHWFLSGLGSSFKNFSTTQRAIIPCMVFRDLISQAESHGIFLNSIHGSTTPTVAFVASQSHRPSNATHGSFSNGRGLGSSRCGFSNGTGRGHWLLHCQICRKDGHYANKCPNIASFSVHARSINANLAQAFNAKCHVTDNAMDWYDAFILQT
ncbi:putative RNA-directed DNA polymerase, partial [Tanacetum coccineum]